MDLRTKIGGAKRAINDNSPSILSGFGLLGVISTAVMAVKATPTAMVQVEKLGIELELDNDERLTRMELLQATWRTYLPATLVGLTTIACIVGANKINIRRNAAIAGLYSITESTMKKYQEKVIETIGEKEHIKIRESLVEDELVNNPVMEDKIFVTGTGETLCYDTLSGRYFFSSQETLRRAENDFNKELLSGYYEDLNGFYRLIGLEDIEMGHNVGWTTDKLMDLYFTSKVAANGEPCLVIEHDSPPKHDFSTK
jgi:hypothetical protein